MRPEHTDVVIGRYWRARDSAIACEQSGDHAQARAWWALASLHARDAAGYTPYPGEAYQLKRTAIEAQINALRALT